MVSAEAAPRSCRVFTPAGLASAIVKSIDAPQDANWLEPCAGPGAFVAALTDFGVTSDRLTAIDLDSDSVGLANMAKVHAGTDFLEWARTTHDRFDCIVANPPFVSISRLPRRLKSSALQTVLPGGRKIRLGANYWCAFLASALNLLRPGGRVAFILPASWEYADYAADLRVAVPSLFHEFDVHRSAAPLFDGVQEGSVVILGRGFGGQHRVTNYFEYSSGDALTAALSKPSHGGQAPNRTEVAIDQEPEAVRRKLGDVVTISIGAVTGDAGYFLMNESKRRKLALPVEACYPVLTHSKDLIDSTIDKTKWLSLRSKDRRVWLFRPKMSLLDRPKVKAYLHLPLDQGGCNTAAHKVKTRNQWHSVRLPDRVDGFISGMSRSGPWICLNKFKRLKATNTLYVVRFKENLTLEQKAAWGLALLTSSARTTLLDLARRYPDGLIKYEPSDLAAVSLPVPQKTSGAIGAYKEAVDALLKGHPELAASYADRWFNQPGKSENKLRPARIRVLVSRKADQTLSTKSNNQSAT